MIIITGAEQGLGRVIVEVMKDSEFVNIPGSIIRSGKSAIEKTIDGILMAENIDGIINNFGVNRLSWIGETKKDDELIYQVNVMAPYWAINHLVKRGIRGRAINVASATYRVPQRCTALYCASKAALVQMTKVMARELAPNGWVINAVAPGLMPETEMARMTEAQILELRGWTKNTADSYAEKLIPAGRPTSTKEVAEAIKKLWEMPDYVNGIVLDIMGGV